VTLLALIVDDEAPARAELRFLLERHGGVQVVGEAASVPEALTLASRLEYDVVFLDINMPDLTGMDAAREIGTWPKRPAVVFVTAHDDQAIQAFSVDAVDYLLKPVSDEVLARSIQRVVALRSGDGAGRRAAPELSRVAVTRRGETQMLDHDEILYAEAEGDYCWIATTGGERLLSSKSMRELEDVLPSTIFFRIHRSYLVNLRKVVALEPLGPGRSQVRLADERGTRLEIARRQTKALKQHLGLR
jgi:two-component system LytT family response regulator/two-component system response regulator LytT